MGCEAGLVPDVGRYTDSVSRRGEDEYRKWGASRWREPDIEHQWLPPYLQN